MGIVVLMLSTMTTESTTVVSKPVSVLDNEEPLVDERLRMLGRVRAHGTYDIRVRGDSEDPMYTKDC